MTQKNSLENTPLYDGKPISYSLVPLELNKGEAHFLENSLTNVLKEVEDFTNSALKDKKLLKLLGLPEDLPADPTPLGLHIPFARFDCFFDGSQIHILELNTDGTSGFNVVDWVGEAAGLKAGENPNHRLSLRLLEAVRAHGKPNQDVVLMDFPNLQTSWEQIDLIGRWGKGAQYANPGVRTWKPGSLIYRRAVSWQLRAASEKARPFLEDWTENKITVVGGWSSDIGMSKAWPAFLKSPFCPETHVLDHDFGKKIEDDKDFWILKGAFSNVGGAVIRGKDVRPEKWTACLKQKAQETALGRPWIAQKLLPLPQRRGENFELGVYFLNGVAAGYLCRAGHDGVISDRSTEVIRPVRVVD